MSNIEDGMGFYPDINPDFEPEVPGEHQEIYRGVQEGRLTPQQLSRLLDRDDLVPELLRVGGFERRLEKYIEKGATGTLIAIDLDDFKRFNDTQGHPAGNDLIRLAGKILLEQTRSHTPSPEIAEKRQNRRQEFDLLARGGDEFFVYLVGAHIPSATIAALRIRRRIVREVQQLFPDYGPEQTMSLGLAYPKEGEDSRTLLQRADQTLYKAKQGKLTGRVKDSVEVSV